MNIATLRALLEGDIDNALIASTPGGIEAQEAAGQRALVDNGGRLPREINYGTREQFEQMGIVFGELADDLFVNVTLPSGWKLAPTDHSMWSHLLDDKGRKRASIFYKAAFYDRAAHMDLDRRYSYHTQPVGGYSANADHRGPKECVVVDGKTVIWTSEPMAQSPDVPSYRLSEILEQQGEVWLRANYPDWQNPLAYWD